jgi:hypothetical protein
MFDGPAPDHATPAPGLDPGLALQLPADTYWHLVHTLRLTLPPPLSGRAEDFSRRDRAAIARVAALAPGNAAEAELATHFVAASEQWKDCLRLAQDAATTPEWAQKCRAQAIGMMRQATSAMRLLLRMQERRRKLETDNAASDRLAWSEHRALALMAEALAAEPERKPEPDAGPAPAPDPEPAAEPAADLIAAAERYAATYPERAAAIRRTGRLPHDVRYFCPPEAALAGALITGRTPALAALDAA